MAVDLKTLEKLLALAKKHKLAELEIEDGKSKFRIRTATGARSAPSYEDESAQESRSSSASTASLRRDSLHQEPPRKPPAIEDDKRVKVMSPFVGTFYRAPSPEADPYVKEGQTVKKGDVLCIVEAMKLMNEIESEVSGKIVSCLAENGQPVEYGEPLFLVEPV